MAYLSLGAWSPGCRVTARFATVLASARGGAYPEAPDRYPLPEIRDEESDDESTEEPEDEQVHQGEAFVVPRRASPTRTDDVIASDLRVFALAICSLEEWVRDDPFEGCAVLRSVALGK